MGHVDPNDIELRRREVERLLVRCHTIPDIIARMRANPRYFAHNGKPFAPRTLKADIRAIRDRWAEEARDKDKDSYREETCATLRATIENAFSRVEVVKDADGKPVLRKNKDGEEVPIVRPNPDNRAVIRGVSVMADILGLKSIKIEDETKRGVKSILDAVEKHMSPDAYGELIRALAIVTGRRDLVGEQGAKPTGTSVH